MSPTIVTVALDPGATTGYAVFHGRTLMAVGTWRKGHIDALHRLLGRERHAADTLRVVIEEPGVRWHAGSKEFLRAKSMATLNQRIGGYEAIARLEDADVIKVLPVSWMRGRKKAEVKRQMGLIYRDRLRALEAETLGQDAWDALGLGTWAIQQRFVADAAKRKP